MNHAVARHRRLSLAQAMLNVSILWPALQIAVGVLLGSIGQLSATAFLCAQVALLLIGGGWFAISHPSHARVARPAPPSTLQIASLATLAFVGALLFGNITTQLITDYDSLFYHLPFVASVHESASLATAGQFEGVRSYPYGWELLSSLFVLPFAADFLVAAPNLVAWAVLGLAAYTLARSLRASRQHTLSALLLLLSLPIVVDQINSVRVDLALAVFFLAGLFYALQVAQTRLAADALFWLVCIGLLTGVKTSGVLYGGLLAIAGVSLRIWFARGASESRPTSVEESRRTALLFWLSGIALLLLVGGFWYARNLLVAGNPLGNVELRVGPSVIFAGAVQASDLRKTTLAAMFDSLDWRHWILLAHQIEGRLSAPLFMLLTMLLALPIRAIASYWTGHTRWMQETNWSRLGGMGFLMLLVALVYWITPFSGDDGSNEWLLTAAWIGQGFRFALPLLGLLAVTAALSASLAGLRTDWPAAAAIAVSLATFAMRSRLYLIAISMVALLLLTFWLTMRQASGAVILTATGKWLWRHRLASTLAVLLLASALLFGLRQVRETRRAAAYGQLPAFIGQESQPHESIGYSLSHQSYLLYGENLDRRVVYIPADMDDPVALRELLTRENISIVAIGPLYPATSTLPIVRLTADSPQNFELIFSDGDDRPALYRLKE